MKKNEVKKRGCKACEKYNPYKYCKDNILCCDYLLELDFFSKRINEKEYNRILLEEEFVKIKELDLIESKRLEKQLARKAQMAEETDSIDLI